MGPLSLVVSHWVTRPELPTLLTKAYDDATFSAMREMGLPQATFPAVRPRAVGEILGDGWLPG